MVFFIIILIINLPVKEWINDEKLDAAIITGDMKSMEIVSVITRCGDTIATGSLTGALK